MYKYNHIEIFKSVIEGMVQWDRTDKLMANLNAAIAKMDRYWLKRAHGYLCEFSSIFFTVVEVLIY